MYCLPLNAQCATELIIEFRRKPVSTDGLFCKVVLTHEEAVKQ